MTRFRAFLWQYDIWQNDLKHWFYSLKFVISGLWQTYDKTDLTMPSQKAVFFFAVFYDKNRPRRAGQPLEPQEQAPVVLTVTVNVILIFFLSF